MDNPSAGEGVPADNAAVGGMPADIVAVEGLPAGMAAVDIHTEEGVQTILAELGNLPAALLLGFV